MANEAGVFFGDLRNKDSEDVEMKIMSRLMNAAVVVCLLALVVTAGLTSTSSAAKLENTIFQVSTLPSLYMAVYDGALTCGELRQKGDFGLGTFDGLDGEMVVLDGKVFQVKDDGRVLAVDDQVTTPFAVVTTFSIDQKAAVANVANYEDLKRSLEHLLPSRNIFYAFRIDGTFNYLKIRSVPKQERPYRPAVQRVFEARNIKGTLVGFWFPGYVEGINLPGFHLHFISDDREVGGHLLECNMVEGIAHLQYLPKFEMLLPDNVEFRAADLSRKSIASMTLFQLIYLAVGRWVGWSLLAIVALVILALVVKRWRGKQSTTAK